MQIWVVKIEKLYTVSFVLAEISHLLTDKFNSKLLSILSQVLKTRIDIFYLLFKVGMVRVPEAATVFRLGAYKCLVMFVFIFFVWVR